MCRSRCSVFRSRWTVVFRRRRLGIRKWQESNQFAGCFWNRRIEEEGGKNKTKRRTREIALLAEGGKKNQGAPHVPFYNQNAATIQDEREETSLFPSLLSPLSRSLSFVLPTFPLPPSPSSYKQTRSVHSPPSPFTQRRTTSRKAPRTLEQPSADRSCA